MTRGPTIVRVAPGGGGGKGIKCCCCRCCECINFGYLTSQHGVIKLAEAVSDSFNLDYFYKNQPETKRRHKNSFDQNLDLHVCWYVYYNNIPKDFIVITSQVLTNS